MEWNEETLKKFRKYQNAFIRNTYQAYTVRFNKEKDSDVIDFLEEENYYKTCDFIAAFAERLISSKVFPVEKEVPGNMKEEIEYYFGRKERQ